MLEKNVLDDLSLNIFFSIFLNYKQKTIKNNLKVFIPLLFIIYLYMNICHRQCNQVIEDA